MKFTLLFLSLFSFSNAWAFTGTEEQWEACSEARSQVFFGQIESIRASYGAEEFQLKSVRMYIEPVEAYTTEVNVDGKTCQLSFRQMLRFRTESVIADGVLSCPGVDGSSNRIRQSSKTPSVCNF